MRTYSTFFLCGPPISALAPKPGPKIFVLLVSLGSCSVFFLTGRFRTASFFFVTTGAVGADDDDEGAVFNKASGTARTPASSSIRRPPDARGRRRHHKTRRRARTSMTTRLNLFHLASRRRASPGRRWSSSGVTNVPEAKTETRAASVASSTRCSWRRRRLGLSQQRGEFFVRRLLAQEPGALFELRGLGVGLGRITNGLRQPSKQTSQSASGVAEGARACAPWRRARRSIKAPCRPGTP